MSKLAPLQLSWLQNLPMTSLLIGRAFGMTADEASQFVEGVEAYPVPHGTWPMYRPEDVVAARPELARHVGVSDRILADPEHHDIPSLWLDRARRALASHVVEHDRGFARSWFMSGRQVGCHIAGRALGLAGRSVHGRLDAAGGLDTPAEPREYIRVMFGSDVAQVWEVHRRATYLRIAAQWDERVRELTPAGAHA